MENGRKYPTYLVPRAMQLEAPTYRLTSAFPEWRLAYGHFPTYRDLSLQVGSQTQEARNISKKSLQAQNVQGRMPIAAIEDGTT